MGITLPDPDTFGEPRERNRDGINTDDYHSLFDYEEDDEDDEEE